MTVHIDFLVEIENINKQLSNTRQKEISTLPVHNILSGLVWCPDSIKETSPFLPWMLLMVTTELSALAPKMDCDHTAIGLLFTYSVFLIA
jgi:hypothetical protein